MKDAIPILTHDQTRALEAALFEQGHMTHEAAMEAVGAAIGDLVYADLKEYAGARSPQSEAHGILLLGKGYNGGDGLIAIKTLLARMPGLRVSILSPFDLAHLKPLCQRIVQDLGSVSDRVHFFWKQINLDFFKKELIFRGKINELELLFCLDGILGLSAAGALDPGIESLVAALNDEASICLRAAIDVPTGLGLAPGGICFKADCTYMAAVPKKMLLETQHREKVGRLRFADVGFFKDRKFVDDFLENYADSSGKKQPSASPLVNKQFSESKQALIPDALITDEILAPLRKTRPVWVDKRDYGTLFVLAGSVSMPGALIMALSGALQSGVGRIIACVPESLLGNLCTAFPEVMWVALELDKGGFYRASHQNTSRVEEALGRSDALLCGPGLGLQGLQLLDFTLKRAAHPCILDADALQSSLIESYRNYPEGLIVTPHAGEKKRLAQGVEDAPDASLLVSVLGAREGGPQRVWVHKGYPTRVETFFKEAVNINGGPVLARGGSGDLLAGLMAGLLASRKEQALFETAAQAVYLHGLAADLCAQANGQHAVRSMQLCPYLGQALLAK